MSVNIRSASHLQQVTKGTPGIDSRFPNTTICVPIVYGSISFPLKNPDEYHTHRWTLYVRGPNNEDLSNGIAKIVFHLHPSFPQSIRELTAPPFEVTEKGWGEFEATIRVIWREPSEKATVLTHSIKLYPPVVLMGEKDQLLFSPLKDNQPVVYEFYDEVVFTDPTESFHKQLMNDSTGSMSQIQSHELPVQENFKTYLDEEDFKALLEAQKFLDGELKSVKERILLTDVSKKELDEAIASADIQSLSQGSGSVEGRSSVENKTHSSEWDESPSKRTKRIY